MLKVEISSEARPRCHAVVTGANGFIGRHLCRALRAGGYRVTGIDLASGRVVCDEHVEGDLTRQGVWASALAGADTVFHLAGKVHALSEVKEEDSEYFRVNTGGTRNLLEAANAARVRRFVFFSTIKAMSRKENAEGGSEIGARTSGGGGCASKVMPFAEQDLIEPDSPYGKSKLEAEKLVLHGRYVPEPVVLRLCMVYGPGAKGNMQKMLEAVDRRRFLPIPEVANRRSMVHVTDVVRAASLAAEHHGAPGETFIVSDGRSYSTREIYNLMCRALGRTPGSCSIPLWLLRSLGILGDGIGRLRGRRFVFDSDTLEKLLGSAWFSSAKIEQKLGFKPEWDLEKAMPQMVDELKRG